MAALNIATKYAAQSTDITTTPSWAAWTDAQILGSALEASTEYVLIHYFSIGGDNTNRVFGSRTLVDGTVVGTGYVESPRVWSRTGTSNLLLSKFTTAATPGAITMETQTLDGSNLTRVESSMIAMPVGDLGADDWRFAEEASSQTISTTMADGASITLPSTGGDDWVVFFTGEFDAQDTSSQPTARLKIGSSTFPSEAERATENEDTREQFNLGGMHILTNAGASETLTVQWGSKSGTGGSKSGTKIYAFRLNAFNSYDTHIGTASATVSSIDTEFTFDVDAGPLSATYTGDHLFLSRVYWPKPDACAIEAQSAIESKVGTGGTYAYRIVGTNNGGSGTTIETTRNGTPSPDHRVGFWEESLSSGNDVYLRGSAEENADAAPAYQAGPMQVAMLSYELAGGGAIQAAWTDGATVSDSLTANLAIQSVVSEAATVSDSNIAAAHFLASVDESLTVSDTGAGIAAILRALSDATSISEVLEAFTTLGAAFAESVQVSDALQARVDSLVALVEAASAGEDQTATAAVTSLLSAGASIADVWSTAAANLAETADNAAAADAWLSISAIFGAIADGAIVDSQFSAAVRAQSSLIDSISATDFYSGAVTGVTEGILSDEAIAGSDFAASARALAETINSAIAGGSFVGITGNEGQLAESVTVADVTIATAFILSAFADSVALSDVWQIIQRGSGALSGSVVTADAWVTVSGNTSSFSDSVSVAGILAAQTVIQSAIAGNVTATADFAATTAGQAALAFSVVVLDQWSQGDELGIVLGAIRLFAALTGMDNVVIYSATDSESIAIRPN